MLIESSFCCSVETSPFNMSGCESRVAVYGWVSHAETCKMLHKFPEHSQGSFLEPVSVTNVQDLDKSSHSNRQTICPEQLITNATSGNALTSLVYSRRKQRVKSSGTFTEHDPGETKRSGDQLDDPLLYSRRKQRVKYTGIFTEFDYEKTNRSGDRLDDLLVYSRKKQRVKSNVTSIGDDPAKTKRSGDQLDGSLVYSRRKQRVKSNVTSTEHDPGKTKRSDNRLDKSLVYTRRKQAVKSNDTFTECDPGKTKRSCYRLDGFLVYSRREQRVKSDGPFTDHDPGQTEKSDGDQLDDSLVYGRRKQTAKSNGTFTERDPGKTKRNGDWLDDFLVYSRSKRRVKSIGTFTEHDPGKTKRNGDQLSFISSAAAASVAEKGQHFISRVELGIRASITHSRVCNQETDVSNPKLTEKFPVAEVAWDSDRRVKNCMHKIRQIDSINDSCSSLKSSNELALVSLKTGANEASECSSSSGAMVAETMAKDISAKDFCISVLRSNQLLDGAWPTRTGSYVEEDTSLEDGSSSSRLCKLCGESGTAKKMLICDKCEEAFHTSCCSVQLKKIPENDEWFCPSCLRTRRKILKETTTKRRGRNSSSKTEVNPIALMLRDTRPYTSGVRIGKNFQAEVPDWSGPTTSDSSLVGEPLEIDPSKYMHELNTNKPERLGSLVNWLQCREEGMDGDICGKWRRAPSFEVQTDDWECFCCVFWDPSHADCAVPQELETNEILEQLKHTDMLRPRLDSRRRKLEGGEGGGALDRASSD